MLVACRYCPDRQTPRILPPCLGCESIRKAKEAAVSQKEEVREKTSLKNRMKAMIGRQFIERTEHLKNILSPHKEPVKIEMKYPSLDAYLSETKEGKE